MVPTEQPSVKPVLKQFTISWRFFIHLAIGLFLLWLCIPKVQSIGTNAGHVFDEIAQEIIEEKQTGPTTDLRTTPLTNDW